MVVGSAFMSLHPFTQVAATVFCCAIPAFGAEVQAEPKQKYNLPGGDAATTLRQFAGVSGRQIIFMMEKVRGERTNAVAGEFSAAEALNRMLAGTALVVHQDRQTKAFLIRREAEKPRSSSEKTTSQPTSFENSPKPMKRKSLVALIAGSLLLASPDLHSAESMGVVSGTVSNAATRNLLEGAKIEMPRLGISTLADNTGRFVLPAVPAGTHEIVASYTGLDPTTTTITVSPGQRTILNFDLTTAIYKLDEFRVTGDREGAAAAITAQRNAGNVKNIVAMDTFGRLPNMNPGEVAIRVPGVAGNLDNEGNITNVMVRGMSSALSSVTIDGGLAPSEGGMSRSFPTSFISGALFDQIEVTKGLTPDKSAASMGGTIDMKTRSPLSMREKRRFTYSFSGRLAPAFTEQIPLREAHRFHPLLNASYQEVFDVFGGERNLGVSITAFYSENVAGFFNSTTDYENTINSPAYVWDYRTLDSYNNRKQSSANIKVDYRLSPFTKISFSALGNNADEPYRRTYEIRAFTTQSIGTTGTAGILPGYTDRVTEVRAAPGSTIEVTSGTFNFYNRLRSIDLRAEHLFDRLELDYGGRYSLAHINPGSSNGGVLINRLTNVGWRLDRSADKIHPGFVQTAGPDFTNPDNYRPTEVNNRNESNNHDIKEAWGNVKYNLPVGIPTSVKVGFNWRFQNAFNDTGVRRWIYTGTEALEPDPSIITYDMIKTGRRIPMWEAAAYMKREGPATPSLWTEDIYFRESRKYIGTRAVEETVTAGYAMAEGKLGREGVLGRTGYLAGVRTERTDMNSWGWVRAHSGSTVAEQLADPFGAVERDYANTRRELKGSYTESFPSAHLMHNVTENLKARLSWSTGFGRPAMTNALPNETFSDVAQTLTINNPSLLPQMATNWDATLDYYFEPVGNLSVGWFHKSIKDYIVSGINMGTIPTGPDNGYGGEFGGYTLLTTANAGTAVVQGWEVSYQQQLTFLPGLLKSLGILANYTILDTHGDFGRTTNLSTGQVANFIPRTGNLIVSWRYRRFSSRVLINYTSDFITSYSATSPGSNLYREKATRVNMGLGYELRPELSITCDFANLFNEPQVLYRGFRERTQRWTHTGMTMTIGIAGRF
jgi:TonB-dependent receptor